MFKFIISLFTSKANDVPAKRIKAVTNRLNTDDRKAYVEWTQNRR